MVKQMRDQTSLSGFTGSLLPRVYATTILVFLCCSPPVASQQVAKPLLNPSKAVLSPQVKALHSQFDVPFAAITRKLEVGDFAIINEVFRDIELPINVTDPIDVGAGITVMLRNLICRKIDIGDILLEFEQPNETSVKFNLDAIQFDAECSFDYDYDGPLLISGSSSGVATTVDNFFSTDVLLSQSVPAIPPDGLDFSNCLTGINILNVDFQGGVVGFLLDLIEPLIRNLIQRKVEEFVCVFVTGMKDRGEELLGSIADLIAPFLEPVNAVDPLSPEVAYNETVDANSIKLVNFMEPTGSISTAVDILLDEANSLLGLERDDANAPSGTGRDLGINVIIRDFILDDDREFEFKTNYGFLNNGIVLNTTAGELADIEIRIERVKLKGLDTFTRFDPFQELGAYTIQGAFAWNSTTIEADVYIAIGPPGSDEKVEETIKVSTSASDLEFSFAALLGISEQGLGELNIGDILDTREILACVFSTIEVVNITSLILSAGTIEDPTIEDIESPGLARILETGLDGAYQLLDELILVAIPGLFQTTVRDFLNGELSRLKDGSECNPVESRTETELVDFRDLLLSPSEAKSMGGTGSEPYGDIGGLLRTLVDDLLIDINPETGRPKINEELIAPLTGFQSGVDGSLRFNQTLFAVKAGLNVGSLDASIVIEAYEARIENLDTILNPLVLIEPTARSPYELDNDVRFGLPERPLRGTARLLIALQGTGINVRDELDITLNLVEAQTTIALLAKIVTSRALSLPLRELLNIHCWLATVTAPALDPQGIRLDGVERTMGLADVMVVFQNLFLNVSCIDCTSPGIQELSDLLETERAAEATTEAANSLLEYATALVDGEFIQIFVDRLLNAAPARCPTNPAYDPNFQGLDLEPFEEVDPPDDSITFLLVVGLSTAGVILCFVVLSFIVKCFVKRRHKKWLRSLPTDEVYRIYREQKREDEKATYLREATSSIFRSKNVPVSVRYLIPVIIVGNIALFLSGHLSLGGSVSVFIQFAGENIVIKDLFALSVADSVIQLYEAGGWQLALLIVLFSGVWPYTKSIITLVAWFLPPRWLSVRKRGSIFIWLDTLAKWSSADIFFLIVSLTAFNISIESPDVPYLPDNFYSANILLTPLWGLYANLIAQLLSQLSSHVIIHYDRKVSKEALEQRDQIEQAEEQALPDDKANEIELSASSVDENAQVVSTPEKLYEHGYSRPHRGITDTVIPRRTVNPILAVTSVAVVALIIAGCVIPSFSFEQLGLLGVAVEVGRLTDEAITEFSVFGIAKTLIDQGRFLGTIQDQLGLGVIAGLMILTIVIVPLVQAAALAYQWFGSLTEQRRGSLEVFIEILSSWQYVEVYLLAVMISVWQLGPTSDFLINSYCSDLTNTFSKLVFYGVLSEEDAQCFRLSGSIRDGCYILIAAAFVLFFVHNFVTRATFQYQRDKVEQHRLANSGPELDNVTQRMMETMEVDEVMDKIHPTLVLFTDTYRWLLVSSPVSVSTLEEIPEASWESPPIQTSSRGTVGKTVATRQSTAIDFEEDSSSESYHGDEA